MFSQPFPPSPSCSLFSAVCTHSTLVQHYCMVKIFYSIGLWVLPLSTLPLAHHVSGLDHWYRRGPHAQILDSSTTWCICQGPWQDDYYVREKVVVMGTKQLGKWPVIPQMKRTGPTANENASTLVSIHHNTLYRLEDISFSLDPYMISSRGKFTISHTTSIPCHITYNLPQGNITLYFSYNFLP